MLTVIGFPYSECDVKQADADFACGKQQIPVVFFISTRETTVSSGFKLMLRGLVIRRPLL